MDIHEVQFSSRSSETTVELAGIPDSLVDLVKQRIIQSLQKKYPDRKFDVNLERFSYVVWNDTSLGCPDEGKFYEQVLTPGYEIHFTVGNQWLTVHTDAKGQLMASPNFDLEMPDDSTDCDINPIWFND